MLAPPVEALAWRMSSHLTCVLVMAIRHALRQVCMSLQQHQGHCSRWAAFLPCLLALVLLGPFPGCAAQCLSARGNAPIFWACISAVFGECLVPPHEGGLPA